MSAPIVERLREPDWHDPACPFRQHCYCDDGVPHDRVRHPHAPTAADTIEALLDTLKDFAEWEPESGVTLEHLAAWMKERARDAIAKAEGGQ
jgi:hypothetical protein